MDSVVEYNIQGSKRKIVPTSSLTLPVVFETDFSQADNDTKIVNWYIGKAILYLLTAVSNSISRENSNCVTWRELILVQNSFQGFLD